MSSYQNILAFETSCDDTAVAIVTGQGEILANIVYSQDSEHTPYGGVVPEIGSRSHIEQIVSKTKIAFEVAKLSPSEINAVAVTCGPGLIGPLLVGAQFAKGFALAQKIPFIPVHHIEGHIFSGATQNNFPKLPFIALIVSGGHTSLYLCQEDNKIITIGQTLDDAAGEAFDKVGRALGLGYPAGKKMDELAMSGDKNRFKFPIAMKNSHGFDFSFSGLKTKALQFIENKDNFCLKDFCASFQEAIAIALVEKAIKACKTKKINKLVLGGGVSSNSRLRELLINNSLKDEINVFLPSKNLCTDNAVMIARAALAKKLSASNFLSDVRSNLKIEERELLLKV